MHLRYPLVLYGSVGFGLATPISLSSPRVMNALSLFLNNGKGAVLGKMLWYLVAYVCHCALNSHSFIHSFIRSL